MIINPRIAAIKDEALRTVSSVKGIMVTLGGGIIPFIGYSTGWVSTGSIAVIVPVAACSAFILMLIWNLSRYAEEGYWHDRKYKLIHNKWKYTPNPDLKTLKAECQGERHLVCLNETISHTTISAAPFENLVPFDPNDNYEIQLDPQSRREHGTMRLREPHRKSGASFAFRIDFTPPLKEGEEAFIKYRFVLPKFKISNLDYLREQCTHAKLDARDYEYNSFKIDYPTEKFIYELNFAKGCCIKPKAVEVERGTTLFQPEQTCVVKNGFFRCEEIDGGWRMKLERAKPPLRVRYRVLWHPPRLHELQKAVQVQTGEH